MYARSLLSRNLLENHFLMLYTSNREDGARLDICAQGFWGDRFRRAFFDIRVFYPNASSYRNLAPSTVVMRKKRRETMKTE